MPAAYLTTPAGDLLFIGYLGTTSDLGDGYTRCYKDKTAG
jgi:hypothetical protein